MGSKGRRPRKPAHSRHLPKVGTSTENERLLGEERHAVLDTLGVGGAASWVKVAVAVIGILLLAGAVAALLLLF